MAEERRMREPALESSEGEEIKPCGEYKEGRLNWLLRFSGKQDEDGLTVVTDMAIHVGTDQIRSLFLLETRWNGRRGEKLASVLEEPKLLDLQAPAPSHFGFQRGR